jgi:hypothetical protein
MTWFLNSFGWTGGSSGGGGTVTGADNGLNLNGTIVELGGNLIKPTVLNADNTNTLIINDSIGQVLNTRDASGNVVLYGFGGTTFTNTTYTFEAYSSGNQYIDSFIVLNFGSINLFDQAIDIFNMGSYCTFDNSSIIYQLGRGCEFFGSGDVTSVGNGNTLNSVYSSIITGFYNTINNSQSLSILGLYNAIDTTNNLIVVGSGNTISNENNKIIIGINDNLMVLDGTNGYVGIGIASPTATIHVKGIDNSPANHSLKVDGFAPNTPLLYVRNDGYSSFNGLSSSIASVESHGLNLHGFVSVVNGLDNIYAGLGITDGSTWFFRANKSGEIQINSTQNSFFIGGGSVGIGTTTPTTSALLDLTSTTGALLVPRMTTIQKNALTAVNGMILYDTTLNKFQGYEAGVWVNLV